jgi:hypothetical protein
MKFSHARPLSQILVLTRTCPHNGSGSFLASFLRVSDLFRARNRSESFWKHPIRVHRIPVLHLAVPCCLRLQNRISALIFFVFHLYNDVDSRKGLTETAQPVFKPRKVKKEKDSTYRDRASERRLGGVNDYAHVRIKT